MDPGFTKEGDTNPMGGYRGVMRRHCGKLVRTKERIRVLGGRHVLGVCPPGSVNVNNNTFWFYTLFGLGHPTLHFFKVHSLQIQHSIRLGRRFCIV